MFGAAVREGSGVSVAVSVVVEGSSYRRGFLRFFRGALSRRGRHLLRTRQVVLGTYCGGPKLSPSLGTDAPRRLTKS